MIILSIKLIIKLKYEKYKLLAKTIQLKYNRPKIQS